MAGVMFVQLSLKLKGSIANTTLKFIRMIFILMGHEGRGQFEDFITNMTGKIPLFGGIFLMFNPQVFF